MPSGRGRAGAPQKRKGIREAIKRARTGKLRKPVQCFYLREVNSASGRVSFSCPAERCTKRCTKLIVDTVFRVSRCKQLSQPPLEDASRGSAASVAPGNRGHLLRASSPSPHGLRLRCLKLRPLAEQLFPSPSPSLRV